MEKRKFFTYDKASKSCEFHINDRHLYLSIDIKANALAIVSICIIVLIRILIWI